MNEAIQSELSLFADANASAICALLSRSPDWLTASELLARLHLPNTEANRRMVRHCAEDLGDELISGQHGYKHVDTASPDEVEHFCRWMDSQGDKMKTRAARTRARKGLNDRD